MNATDKPSPGPDGGERMLPAVRQSRCAAFMRATEADRIVRHLIEGTSVDLGGTRWSGRTELVRAVSEALDERGFTVLLVRGAGAELAMEALRSALPPKLRKAVSERTNRVAALIDALVTIVTNGPSVILIDDVDDLDGTSWAVIESVHKSTGVALLGTSRERGSSAELDRTLLSVARPVVGMKLAPLRPDMTREILEARLNGRISVELSARVHQLSSGMPGLAVAFTDALLATGGLRVKSEVWTAEGEPWCDHLTRLFDSFLRAHPPEVRDALETLALVGVVDLDSAVAAVGQAMVEQLEGDALLTVITASGRGFVAVNPQGLATWLRERPLSGRRVRLLEQLTDRLGPAPSARRLHEEALPIDHPAITALFVECGPAQAEADESARYLGPENERSIDDPGDILALRRLQSRRLIEHGASLAEMLRTLDVPDDASPPVRAGLLLLQLELRIEFEGVPADYEQQITSIGHGGATVPRELAKLVLALAHLHSGRGDDALDVLGTVEPVGDRMLTAAAHYLTGLALFASGRQLGALDHATRQLDLAIACRDDRALVANAYVAALALTSLGRLDEAWELGELVTGLGLRSTPFGFSPDRSLLVIQALAAFDKARTSAGDTFIERAMELSNRSNGLPFAGPDWDVGATASGSDKKRGRVYRALADGLRRRGYVLAADVASLISLTAYYDEAYHQSVEKSLVATGGELHRGHLTALRGAHVENAIELMEGAATVQRAGASRPAARFYAMAARIFREQGSVSDARTARGLARELGGLELNRADTALEPLSPRELEIATFIDAGLTNAQIGARLAISTRTIESHINRISRKTGAVDRDDIGALSRT